MKSVIFIIICPFLISVSLASTAKTNKMGNKRRAKMRAISQLSIALKQSKAGRYTESTKRLFLLMHNPLFKQQKNQIRYHLALNLYNMRLYHPAVFQFQMLVKSKSKKYTGKSLQKIALAATHLGDDQLLNHAITHGSLKYISHSDRQKLHYHIGELWMRRRNFRRAIIHFARVKPSNPFFYQALYQMGLAHAEKGSASKAVFIFNNLKNRLVGITNNLKIAALMGKARSYYQAKQWKQSVETYLQVPKDSPFWHDTLLERSWALLRGGRLRSSLSNFQNLHSYYYATYYQPESLLLRSIIYLYICKYYEMEKVLDLFHKTYRPVYLNVKNLINSPYSRKAYYQSLLLSLSKKSSSASVHYPLPVARRIFREGDFSAIHYYITQLKKERELVYSEPYSWRRSKVGQYSTNLIKKRLSNAQKKAGRKALAHLKRIQAELKDFLLQEEYIRYEMLRSKRGVLKKRIAQKIVHTASVEDFDRSFYIQNGYEYWPFKGEYWLDELGNYHYVGMGSCHK